MAESESPLYAYGAAAVLGVVSHIGYFNRSEHHLHGTRYLQLFLLTYATAVFVLSRTASPTSFDFHTLALAARSAAALAASFLAGLYTSLLTYRLTPLHPLHRFPGPVLARATSLWLPFNVWHKFTPTSSATSHTIPQAFKTLTALHATHGPYVRVGTAELSIADPAAVPLIYGGTSTCSKAAWYDNDAPLTSMQTSRDRGYHDARRRVWAKAFAERAVRGFEGRVQRFVGELVERIGEMGEGGKKEVDARKWFGWFAYDVMGELAFGREFGMVRGGKEHWAIGLLNEGMMPLGLLLPPWAFRILAAIPGAAADYWKFITYCAGQLDQRMRTAPEDPDILSSLIEPVKDRELTPGELTMLQADSRLIIVAGSDTTSSTLTHIFYHLAATPHHQTTLLAELRPHIQPDGTIPHRAIQDLPHLNGTINEALRLHPPVPSAIQRLTPPSGLTLPNGTHIPGNTVVWCPSYVVGRSADAYVEPETFCPERWYAESKKGWVRNEKAFAPFSLGPYGCIGRPLALMELRLVIARVLAVFEVGLAEGEDGRALLEGSRDHFTLECGALRLCFRERV
ncbi:Cytochrome p450 protein [Lasiodiplodia theobromae]|uniref:Cytochrome p450 protein n=1 Tax=Lasiodiplodia theobromae TaxID=45133 RepID=UPI0015C3E375|nr:Cytochrome p450 protein [Lasiodiplodia theobromae]KAF4546295.1 Cytochrome p450 protein [Lasiodiplodia theobromae]